MDRTTHEVRKHVPVWQRNEEKHLKILLWRVRFAGTVLGLQQFVYLFICLRFCSFDVGVFAAI